MCSERGTACTQPTARHFNPVQGFSQSFGSVSVHFPFSIAAKDCHNAIMTSVARSLEKFRASLENGTFYEAQQLVKTVYHRLRSRKLLEESRELLEKAACLQLQYQQVRRGQHTLQVRRSAHYSLFFTQIWGALRARPLRTSLMLLILTMAQQPAARISLLHDSRLPDASAVYHR